MWPSRVVLATTAGLGWVLFAESTRFVTIRQATRNASAWEMPPPSVSADGRYVAFASYARLSSSDTNSSSDIYVLDRQSGSVTPETGPAAGDGRERDSSAPRISADGRFVVYETTHEDGSDGHEVRIIVLRDRQSGTTRVMQGTSGPPNGSSRQPAISGDGRIVAFASAATNLVEGEDANGHVDDVYTYDTESGHMARVSLDGAGHQPESGASFAPAVSADARFIAFTSTAYLDGISPPDKPLANVYRRDTRLGGTTRISTPRRGTLPNGGSYDAAISADGRYIAFTSDASNLVSGDLNGVSDVFVRDTAEGLTTLISRSVSRASANGPSGRAAISASGAVIAFQSEASDMICGFRCGASKKDINLVADVFLFSTVDRTMTCLSAGRTPWMQPSAAVALDATGAVIVFSSRHPVDAQDVANDFDLFVRFGST